MKTLKQNGNVIIMCIMEAAAGILLLVNPVGFTAGIIIAAGIALIIDGLLNVIRYFRSSPEESAAGQLLARGLLTLLAGAFCAFQSEWFIVTFPMIAILYGVAVLIGGLSKIQITMDMLRAKNPKWWWGALSAVISIVCAFVIIKNPFSSTVVMWWFTGISLLVEAVFDAVTLLLRRKMNRGSEA